MTAMTAMQSAMLRAKVRASMAMRSTSVPYKPEIKVPPVHGVDVSIAPTLRKRAARPEKRAL